jgi:hypothetical protein
MGHCVKFGYVLWATVVNLVMRYGPLWKLMKSYALWATTADLVICYGPLRGIKPYNKNL